MRYPLSPSNAIHPDATDAAIAVLRSNRTTMGPAVEAFEAAFAQQVGAKHAIMVNSGSSANLLAVEALTKPSDGIPTWNVGDEILVPAVAWSTTVFPLVQAGLIPVFCDVDPHTLALSPVTMDGMLTDKTRGIMLIHVLGMPADPLVATYAELHGLTLVEDCCESFGAPVGRSGVLATYSHFYSHQLTTMEGGTVTTDSDAVADDLRSMRSHGWTRHRRDRVDWESDYDFIDPSFLFVSTGYNVRPLELQGAMGVEQLKHVEQMQREKRIAAQTLRAVLCVVPWLDVVGDDANACRMNLPLRLAPEAPLTRAQVVDIFNQEGIETRPIIAGNILKHPVMVDITYEYDKTPVADSVMDRGFMIGCHAGVHEALPAFDRVADRLLKAGR